MKAFIHKIQYYFFTKKLNAIIPKGIEHVGMNYKSARTLGVVYDASDSEVEAFIESFKKERSAKNQQIEVLGYTENVVKGTIIPPHLFSKNDLQWNLIPNSFKVDEFVSKEFDILICLQTKNIPAIEYVVAMSHAKYRVGKFIENKETYFELMIQDDENHDVSYLIQQINNFLLNLKMANA